MTPFFQASRRSLAYQFTIIAPFWCTRFQILEKFSIFSLVLVKISALKTQIFRIFVPKTPHFSRKIRSLDPTFGNPCGTHPPKKKLSGPPGNMHKLWYKTFKVRGTSIIIIIITSYWYYNLFLLPKSLDDFAMNVFWLINSWSMTDQVSVDAALVLLSD